MAAPALPPPPARPPAPPPATVPAPPPAVALPAAPPAPPPLVVPAPLIAPAMLGVPAALAPAVDMGEGVPPSPHAATHTKLAMTTEQHTGRPISMLGSPKS